MPGQNTCLPCGSEAMQPAEGQETCICLGKGQVFQPRDAHCTCPPGYWRSLNDGRHCVRQAYDICRDSASRNQEGQCLTKEGWVHYCSEKVCTVPRDYQGYDKVLGLCICQTDSLESVCNSQCRRQQRDILQVACTDKNAQLFVTYRNGSKIAVFLEELRRVLLRPYFSLKDTCTSEQSKYTHPAFIVKMSGKGFLGVYDPDPQLFHNFMLNEASSHNKDRPSSAIDSVMSRHEEHSWVQSLKPSNSTSKIIFTGILNPITCINVNVTIIFIVSKEHYPVYDVNNLYNTNAEFDWGDLRSLREEVREAQQFLFFLFQFQHPGTYVLQLSSNRHKKMYIRVMPLGGQCYEEGPFFPTTPRYAVQVGIAKNQDLLLKPDWTAVTAVITGLLVLLIASVVLTLLCQGLSWPQKGTTRPPYRRQQLKYNLDSYSSNVSTVFSIKKCHPLLQNKGSMDDDSRSTDGTAGFLKRGDVWESEEQIDLESFNTDVFFELLLRQSLSVTTKLGHFKDEVKTIYRKLTSEISSLKNLWIKTLSTPEVMEVYESTMTEAYLKAKQQAEEEMQQRKRLAAEYEENVNQQIHLLQHDLKGQEEHCIMFNSALREVVRLAEMLTNKVACKGNQTTRSQPDYSSLLTQIEVASSKMSSIITKESHRLKAWGVLGDGMGAHLLNKSKTRILTKQELVGSNGTAGAPDVVCMDPITGLLNPYPHCTMLLTGQCPGPVPSDCFLHPETGKVLYVAGNIGYDPIISRLVCVVDSASGKRQKAEVPIFPYIPYPVCPNTGLPVKTKLPVLCSENLFAMGGLMLDPVTEIEVPVLGVTIHPHTGQKLAVGGTYLNPLTGMLTPLEIGGPMAEPKGGKIVPILGVGLDSNTGEVIPLGGLVGPSGNIMLLGDAFTEPLSGKTTRVHGAHLRQDEVRPHSGSYQAVLEADWLVSQSHVVNAIEQFKASVVEDTCLVADRLAALKASVEDMKKSFTTKFYHAIHSLRSLEKKLQIASSLKSNGGKLGMIKYPSTEMWIPAVFGMKIPDPGGSGLMVPILGIDCDWNTRQPFPLAGTMEDRNGKGLVPITIGARTISPVTGETGPVIGAQTNPWTHNIIPTVQSLGALPRRAADPDLLDFLEKEINSRHIYWHCRRKKEEGLLKRLNSLFFHVLDAAKEGKAQKVKYKEKVKGIEEICHFLKESSLQEVERRTSKYFSSQLATELSLLFKADRDEKEQEIQVLLEIRKALEKLMEFAEKMQLEEERIYMQLIEREKQRIHISSTETVTNLKLRKAILALASESQQHILKQQASVEIAYTKLEYLRDLSNIQMQQTKVLFSGSQQCFENYQTTRFYGICGISHNTHEVIQQNLIPLLKSTVRMLEENSKSSISPETSGYSSTTLKASGAHSEALRAETSQETASVSIASPALPTSLSERTSHVQEIQTRFFFEKHACELAHMELSLLTEEINTIFAFYELSKAEEKEYHTGSWGMRTSKGTEATSTKDSLLKELSEHHHHTEQSLRQKQLEEIKHSGLSPNLVLPKQTLHFLEEIPHQFSFCLLGLQIPDSNFTEHQKLHSWEVKHSPDSLTQILQVSAAKIVKLEALRQTCLYRVLDVYSSLQILTCPEGVLRILNSFGYKNNGEEAAREVAHSIEKQQVARAVAFLQRHHQEGDLLKGLKEESEAELRNMQAQFRLELQAQTEEKMQAKEMQVIQETEGEKLGNLMAYFILSQRHLRQTVVLLQDCYKLKKIALRSQKEGTGLEQLVVEELSISDDTRDISYLLKDNTEYIFLVLEFIQTVRLLQLRETQFKEIVRNLKGCMQDKFLNEANIIANELKEFRQQKMRRLEEQLKLFLGSKRTKMTISSHFDPLQNLMKECTEMKAFFGKDFHPDLQRLRMKPKEAKKEKETQQSNSPLSSITNSYSVPGIHHKADDQLLLFLTKNIKVLKQAEHLMASRIILLNPQLTPPSLYGADKTKCIKSSFLLGLLKDVNDELQSHAVAAGLLESQRLDKKKASTYQGIQDALTTQEELTVVDPATLSPREFVIYQYGISILRFLRLHIDAPEINLCLASSIPLSNVTGNAFRNSFFYQHSKHKLFILKDCLSSVGSFLLLLVHCLAHITAADFNHDTNPLFLRLFHQALKACLTETFSLRLQLSAARQGDKCYGINELLLKKEPFSKEEVRLISQLFEVKVKSLTDMEAFEQVIRNIMRPGLVESSPSLRNQIKACKSNTDLLSLLLCLLHNTKNNISLQREFEEPVNDKLLVKKKEHFLHTSSSHEKGRSGWRTRFEEETHTYLSTSELEDKVDVLTEELVRIIEDEHQFLKSKGNEDLLLYYLEITGLEKDCLVKQINALEEKLDLGRKL
ncbi:uncharacterized protein LOC134158598 isoform X3 [Pezoporus occidentalis]